MPAAPRSAPAPSGAAALPAARRSPLERALSALALQPGELGRTLSLYAALTCVACVFILGRTIRDTLFLARYDAHRLPWMYVAFGLASSPIALFFGRIAGRFRRERLLCGFIAVVAASDIAVYLIVHADRHHGGLGWIYPVYYVWADLSANLLFVLFWMLSNDLHTTRDAKRLYGLIGLGSVSGILLAGIGGRAALEVMSIDELLFVLVGLLAILAALVLHIAAHYPKVTPALPTRAAVREKMPWGYIGILTGVLLATFTAAQVADYQWKLIAKERYLGDALAHYFVLYNVVVGAIAFGFQILFTQKILSRLGVLAGMLFMPLVIGLGSTWLLLAPGVVAVSFMKFGDAGFQFTINDATYQILYFPFPEAKKAQARMIVNGVAKPLGYALGGVVLLLLASHLSVPHLSWVTLPVVAVWVLAAFGTRRGYVRALAATLSSPAARNIDEGPPDAAEKKVLEGALASNDPAQIGYAADRLLASHPAELPEICLELAEHPKAQVRRRALEAAAKVPLTELRDRAAELAEKDPSPEVRAAALAALGAADPEGSLEVLESKLGASEPVERKGALAALLRYGSLDGVLAAGGPLKALLRSEEPRAREEAAEVLGRVGNPSFYRPVCDLLRDPDPRVRSAACAAAAVLRHPRLLPPLVEAAARRGSRSAAALALSSFGADAIGPIAEELKAEHRVSDPGARRRLAGALGHIPALPAYQAAIAALPDEGDARVRYSLAKSAVKVRAALDLPPLAERVLRPLLERELCAAFEIDEGRAALERAFAERPLLDEALRLQLRHARRRVLRLLALAHPPDLLALVDKNLEASEASARSNAVEVLDNVLPPPDRRTVLPLLEAAAGEGTAAARRARLGGALPLRAPTAEGLLARLASGRDQYLAACAFHVGAKNRVASLAESAGRAARESPFSIVRESATMLLRALEAAQPVAQAIGGEDMYTTTEKILFLKGVSLFSEVPGEDLAAIARSAALIEADPGVAVVHEGEIGDALYVILRGSVRVTRGGRELARLAKGECFGEMAVLDREPRSASVTAAEPSQMLRIAQDDFYEILGDHPEIAEGVLRVLTHRLRQAGADVH